MIVLCVCAQISVDEAMPYFLEINACWRLYGGMKLECGVAARVELFLISVLTMRVGVITGLKPAKLIKTPSCDLKQEKWRLPLRDLSLIPTYM